VAADIWTVRPLLRCVRHLTNSSPRKWPAHRGLGDELVATKGKLEDTRLGAHALEQKVLSLMHLCQQHTNTISEKQKDLDQLRLEHAKTMAELPNHKEDMVKTRDADIAALQAELSTHKALLQGMTQKLEDAEDKLHSVSLFRQTMHEVHHRWNARRKILQSIHSGRGRTTRARGRPRFCCHQKEGIGEEISTKKKNHTSLTVTCFFVLLFTKSGQNFKQNIVRLLNWIGHLNWLSKTRQCS